MYTPSFFDPLLKDSLLNMFQDRVLFDQPLAPYVAYNIGGPADVLILPKNEQELIWTVSFAKKNNIALTPIGKGTNVLVPDEGIRGITLAIISGFSSVRVFEKHAHYSLVLAECGIEKTKLLEWAITHGLGGLEFSAGIPGTLAGGIFMNAGTKFGCYGDVIEKIRLLDFFKGPFEISRKGFSFGYRSQSLEKNIFILSALLKLEHAVPDKTRQTVRQILKERAEKQPLDYPSCGSTFKNPEGHSAGRLIEKADLKGFRIGGAEISTKHANFILNKGGATAQDILGVIKHAQSTVFKIFKIRLECEIIMLNPKGSFFSGITQK